MKILRIPIVVLLLFSIAFLMACPKKDAVRQAAKASYRLPGSTNDLIARIKDGVARGIFTPAEARRAGAILEPLADAEIAFVRIVRTAEIVYRTTGAIDAVNLKLIQDKYSEIVDLFLDLLEFTKVLSPENRAFLDVAIASVRLFLRTIGIGFGSSAVDKLATAIVTPDPSFPAGPRPRKGKKGIATTTAGLFGSIRPFASNPQLRFA